MSTSRILIADDHPLFREALRHVCERIAPDADFVEASGHAELSQATREDERFDLVVVDLMMPGGDDLSELKALRKRTPATPTVVVSSRADAATIRRTMSCGVSGYIPKSMSAAEMEEALRRILAGEIFVPLDRDESDATVESEFEALTPRQSAVLEQLSRGRSNRQIAADLNIEEITVKVHISAILRKLHVKNRLEAVLASQRVG